MIHSSVFSFFVFFSRFLRVHQAAYDGLPDSNVAPADPATAGAGARGGGSSTAAAAVLGRHAEALVQTFISLVGDDQVRCGGGCVVVGTHGVIVFVIFSLFRSPIF